MKFEILKIQDAQIIVLELTETVNELIQFVQLSDNERIEFANIQSEKRKFEFLGIRFACKKLTGKNADLVYDENGKPHFSKQKLNISISHTKNLFAVVVHPNRHVGIDIEQNTDKVQKVYHRFLSKKEQITFGNVINIRELQIIWSAKEALYKIIGHEAVDFANQLEISSFEINKTGNLDGIHLPTQKSFKLNYKLTDQYTLVYCID